MQLGVRRAGGKNILVFFNYRQLNGCLGFCLDGHYFLDSMISQETIHFCSKSLKRGRAEQASKRPLSRARGQHAAFQEIWSEFAVMPKKWTAYSGMDRHSSMGTVAVRPRPLPEGLVCRARQRGAIWLGTA